MGHDLYRRMMKECADRGALSRDDNTECLRDLVSSEISIRIEEAKSVSYVVGSDIYLRLGLADEVREKCAVRPTNMLEACLRASGWTLLP